MALTKVGKGGLDKGSIKDQTNLGSEAADTDEFLLYDADADELKAIQSQNVVGPGIITNKSELLAAASGDQVLIYDISASALKKVTQANFLNFPNVSSVSPTNAVSGDGTGNHTFVITGTGFTGATATLVNNAGTTVNFASQTVDSDTQITGVIAKSSLPNSGEPFDVRVTAGSGLQHTLENQINVDANPIFSAAAGSLGTVANGARTGVSFTVEAADPESGGDIVYTLESGSIPSGLSFSSTSSGAVISGNANAVGSDTTSTFTIRAKDVNSNTSDRQFTITVNAPSYNSFTSSGTFSVPSGLTAVDVLVVAGGGGSGSWGGGGGAGGLIYRPAFPVTPGGTVTVTVGDGGGNGGTSETGQPGQDSAFGTLTAKGGGYGGYHNANGAPGGSGGGAGRDSGQGGQPATQPNQPGESGNYGFGNISGQVGPGGSHGASGGGGAGGAGQQGAGPAISGFPDGSTGYPSPYSNGGVGRAYTIADGSTPVYYAGGGGGGVQRQPSPNISAGGQGGGGRGGTEVPGVAGSPGTANRGGGGGGGGNPSSPQATGGTGGKGIVIVSY
jgi:hypothetical protein